MTNATIERRTGAAPSPWVVPRDPGRLAVALHGVGPASFEQCALIREWLEDLGVERVTLCVGATTSPPRPGSAMAAWLRERQDRGDVVVLDAARPPHLDRWTAAGLPRPAWPGATRRIDVHPCDLDAGPRRTRAVERALRRAAGRRRTVTLDELPEAAPAGIPAEPPGVLLTP